jgi:hypothetical protein
MDTNYESESFCQFPCTGDKRNAYKVLDVPAIEEGNIERGII